MRWVVLASLVLAEISLLLILIQAMARWLHAWLRWPLWLLLVALSSVATGWLLYRPLGNGNSEHFLSSTSPFVTYRYFVFVAIAAVPISLLLLGVFSLLRWKEGGLGVLKWRVGWRRSAQFLLLSCCGAVASLFFHDWLVCRSLRELIDKSSQIALSVKPSDCRPEENAAPIYLDVGSSPQLSDKGLPDFSKDKRRILDPKWQTYFAQNAGLAEKVRSASSRPSCLFEKDWSNPDPTVMSPEVGPLKACVRVLATEGLSAALTGDTDLAVRDAAALRRMAEQLCSDPRAIHRLFARLAEESAFNVIEAVLFVRKLTPKEISLLAHRPNFEFRQSLVSHCTWEEAEYYQMIARAYLGTDITDKDYKLPGHRQLTAAVLLRNRLLHAPDDLAAMPLIFADLKHRCAYRYDQLIPKAERALPGGATIVESMHTVYVVVRTQVHADAVRVLTDFGMKLGSNGLIERILQEGPEAVPASERPLDPQAKMPMQITVKHEGVILYGVGWDGWDDGGEEISYSKSDLTFCFGYAFVARRLTPPVEELEQD